MKIELLTAQPPYSQWNRCTDHYARHSSETEWKQNEMAWMWNHKFIGISYVAWCCYSVWKCSWNVRSSVRNTMESHSKREKERERNGRNGLFEMLTMCRLYICYCIGLSPSTWFRFVARINGFLQIPFGHLCRSDRIGHWIPSRLYTC